MSKLIKSVMANLTFTVGQLEEIKSNINDTVRYIKQNADQWDSEAESKEEESATTELTKPD